MVNLLQDEDRAEQMLVQAFWPNGVQCPKCDSQDIYECIDNLPMRFRCSRCYRYFSTKSGTLMHGSPLPYSKWAVAIYLLTSSGKGVSSVQLARDVGVTQKTAWSMSHRIREAMTSDDQLFVGPVEVDETYVGGEDKNRHWRNKLWLKSFGARTLVIGMKDRATGKVKTSVLSSANHLAMTRFVQDNLKDIAHADIYTDGHAAYRKLRTFFHEAIIHSDKEYVKWGDVHTNGIEAFWSILKRGIVGTYHYVSPKHTHRYATEYEFRHNAEKDGLGTLGKVWKVMIGLANKRLPWKKLVGRPGHAAPWQPPLGRQVDRVFGEGIYDQRESEIETGEFVTYWRTGLPEERPKAA